MKKLITTTLLFLGITSLSATSNSQYENDPHTSKVNTIYIALDNSGSMKNEFKWISKTLASLNERLNDKLDYPINMELYGFTNQTERLAQGDVESILDAIKIMETSAGNEDGLIPIDEIANLSDIPSHPQMDTQNAHIILFTDENRTAMKNIKIPDLENKLRQQNITLHVVVPDLNIAFGEQLIDLEGVNLGLKDQQSYHQTLMQTSEAQKQAHYKNKYEEFCQQKINGKQPYMCTADAGYKKWLSYIGEPKDDYINLAFATGGSVWDMNRIEKNHRTFTSFIASMISSNEQEVHYAPIVNIINNAQSNHIRANEMLTFEAKLNQNLMKEHSVEQWYWDFDGNGTIDDQGPVVTHTFNQPGIHKVKLWISYRTQDEYGYQYDSDKKPKALRIIRVEVHQ